MLTKEELPPMVDHTNLNMDATTEDIERLCQEAIDYHFGAVCVRPDKVVSVSSYLLIEVVKGRVELPLYGPNAYGPNIASVVGFPTKKTSSVGEMIENLSQYSTVDKIKETEHAFLHGASEFDMVINLGAMKRGDYHLVEDDIRAVVLSAPESKILKVIIESCYLTDMEKALACKIAECAGADFVKTSTGFGTGGATLADIELMGKVVTSDTGIKASAGISTIEFALQLYEASQKYRAHDFRVGASKLVNEYRK